MWISLTFILSSYAALYIPANWKFWWWLSAVGTMVWDLDAGWEIRAWSWQTQPMPLFGVIPVCCEVWIAVVAIFLRVLCLNLKDLKMVFDIKHHLKRDNLLSAQLTVHACVTATCTDLPSSFKALFPLAFFLPWTPFHRITQSLLEGTLLVISFLLAIPGAALSILTSVPRASCSDVCSSSKIKKINPVALGNVHSANAHCYDKRNDCHLR